MGLTSFFRNKFKGKKPDFAYGPELQSSKYLQKYLQYKKDNNKRFILIVSVGRSGTRSLAEIFNQHNRVKGSCEENIFTEHFYRYVKWNQLPIDLTGVFNILAARILNDWKDANLSVIASPGLSIDFLDVCKKLEVDEVIWGVNNAKFTVSSFYDKGWYLEEACIQNPDLAMGLQPFFRYRNVDYRTFSRIIPRGDFFYTWEKLTRVGKIAWFYNALNLKIYEQFKTMNPKTKWIFKLEEADQNYDYYLKMAKRFSLYPLLEKRKFLSIRRQFVEPGQKLQKEWKLEKSAWSPKELKEFELYSKEFQKIYPTLKN